jgi:hypothetical protein
MIHDLFIAHESLYGENEVKRNIALIFFMRRNISTYVLMLMENILDICINVD